MKVFLSNLTLSLLYLHAVGLIRAYFSFKIQNQPLSGIQKNILQNIIIIIIIFYNVCVTAAMFIAFF